MNTGKNRHEFHELARIQNGPDQFVKISEIRV